MGEENRWHTAIDPTAVNQGHVDGGKEVTCRRRSYSGTEGDMPTAVKMRRAVIGPTVAEKGHADFGKNVACRPWPYGGRERACRGR